MALPERSTGWEQQGLDRLQKVMPDKDVRQLIAEHSLADPGMFAHSFRVYERMNTVVSASVDAGLLSKKDAKSVEKRSVCAPGHDWGKCGIIPRNIHGSVQAMHINKTTQHADTRPPETKALHGSHVVLSAWMYQLVWADSIGAGDIFAHHESATDLSSLRGKKIPYFRNKFRHEESPMSRTCNVLLSATDILDALTYQREYAEGEKMSGDEIRHELTLHFSPERFTGTLFRGGNLSEIQKQFIYVAMRQFAPDVNFTNGVPKVYFWGDNPLVQKGDERLAFLEKIIASVWQAKGDDIECRKQDLTRRYRELLSD